MAAKTRKPDPLSRYFQDLNEEELSNGGEDDEEYKLPATSSLTLKKDDLQVNSHIKNNTDFSKNSNISKSRETANLQDKKDKEKLPSANECLGSQSKPTFLKVLDKPDLNWDALEKRLAGDDNEIVEYKTNAVPPPPSYEPITDPGIKVVDKEGRKRKTSENDSSSKAYKIHRENDDE